MAHSLAGVTALRRSNINSCILQRYPPSPPTSVLRVSVQGVTKDFSLTPSISSTQACDVHSNEVTVAAAASLLALRSPAHPLLATMPLLRSTRARSVPAVRARARLHSARARASPSAALSRRTRQRAARWVRIPAQVTRTCPECAVPCQTREYHRQCSPRQR